MRKTILAIAAIELAISLAAAPAMAKDCLTDGRITHHERTSP